jgi:hypothetical protein
MSTVAENQGSANATTIPDPEPITPPKKKRGGGPRTPEGKRRSSMNALKDALTARVVLPDELVAAMERYQVDLTKKYAPRTSDEEFWVADMARSLAQLDRCKELAIADLRNCLYTARCAWDDDRRTAAEKLGKKLAKQPSLVSDALEHTLHGAEWKILRWEGIRTIIREKGRASEELHRLACDLVGLPLELRSGSYLVPSASDPAGLAALADQEIQRLKDRQETVLAERDEFWQMMAADAMPLVEDPNTTHLRLCEAMIRRIYRQAEARIEKSRQEHETATAAAAAAGGSSPSSKAPSNPYMPKMSDAAIKFQNERTLDAMHEEMERWRAEQAQAESQSQTAAQRTAGPPPEETEPTTKTSAAGTPRPTPTPTPTPTPASTPTPTPTPKSPAPPTARPPQPQPQAKTRPLNRFEQAEAKRLARKAAREAKKQARRAARGR